MEANLLVTDKRNFDLRFVCVCACACACACARARACVRVCMESLAISNTVDTWNFFYSVMSNCHRQGVVVGTRLSFVSC